jgi:hypothetical protein
MLAEKFAKQNGIEWHDWEDRPIGYKNQYYKCSCGIMGCFNKNPTFSHPEEVLAVCQKWDDYRAFIVKLVSELKDDGTLSDMVKSFIETYITTPNKLLEAAVEWREK